MKKTKYTGKFIIAFDTICDGWQCVTDEKNNPTLFSDRNEAVKEMFDDALSMLESRTAKELKEYNVGVTKALVKKMKETYASGNVAAMEKFLEKYPNCNDNNEFIVPAEEYIQNRKTIFTGKGVQITGQKLK